MNRTPIGEAMTALMTLYPRIYFACHTRHVRDPQTQRLLSRHQASILDHLDELEPTTVMDLAAHLGVTSATMSLAIDRLERKGYVVRLRDAKDRRRVHVRLTTAGVRIKEASSVLDPERVQRLVARLSDTERTRAIEGLGLLAQAAEESMRAGNQEPEAGSRKLEAGSRKLEAGSEVKKEA
ncbi:MAG TPA: MarR family transcriptional regulator [Vicinamibacterales bacterium]|nr:MarR family transcriptional regulator [Vicinamibacterales bacterium]